MEITVSIVVAMYNSANYLKTCVTSLLSQTLENYEIILVNDCSPDNSLEIALQYEKKHPDIIKVVNHKENLRAGGARNSGLKVARGKYVWFVDADDWLAPTALEEAYNVAEKNRSDVVSVDFFEISTEDTDPICLQTGVLDSCSGVMDDKKRIEYIVSCKGGFSKLIKREYILKHKLFYPERIRFEDNGIVPLIGAMATRVDTIHKGLYFYRTGNANSQTSAVSNETVIKDRLKAMEYFYDKAQELEIANKLHLGIEYFYVYICYISVIRSFIMHRSVFSKKMFYEIRKETHKKFPKFNHNMYLKLYINGLEKVALYAAELGFLPVIILRSVYSIYRGIKCHI